MRLCFFTVTQEDIDKGQRRNARACPVARGMRRAVDRIWPNQQSFVLDKARIPRRLLEYMRQADRGLPIEPATFIIDLDDATPGDVWGSLRTWP